MSLYSKFSGCLRESFPITSKTVRGRDLDNMDSTGIKGGMFKDPKLNVRQIETV